MQTGREDKKLDAKQLAEIEKEQAKLSGLAKEPKKIGRKTKVIRPINFQALLEAEDVMYLDRIVKTAAQEEKFAKGDYSSTSRAEAVELMIRLWREEPPTVLPVTSISEKSQDPVAMSILIPASLHEMMVVELYPQMQQLIWAAGGRKEVNRRIFVVLLLGWWRQKHGDDGEKKKC